VIPATGAAGTTGSAGAAGTTGSAGAGPGLRVCAEAIDKRLRLTGDKLCIRGISKHQLFQFFLYLNLIKFK
jgi:hypothetical protein